MTDVIDEALGIAAGTKLDRLRAARPEVRKRTQSSYDALFDPAEENNLAQGERFAIAVRVAESSGSLALAAHYRARLEPLSIGAGEARWAAIFRHVELLTRAPRNVTPADLQALTAAGFDDATIVTVSQIVSFVAYQARVAATLALLGEDA
jgi:uncharacterized protein YciW